MASYGAMLRPSALASSAVVERAKEGVRSTHKALARFARPRAFGLPPNTEAAAVRAVRNVIRFRLHYALLLWVILLASLAPRRRVSLVFLMASSKVAASYGVLLRAFPNSAFLHRIIDRRLVVALFLIVIVVQLALTGALKHLLLSLAAGIPVVLIHAVFQTDGDLSATEAAAAELDPIAAEKKEGGGDLELASL